MKKFLTWLFVAAFLTLAGFIYFKFYFPVASDAVKSGQLNAFMYKGYIWKTYEGKLIQAGFKSRDNAPGVQSNEFDFSVVDEDVAEELMKCTGKLVSLRYKQYNGYLPWRGMQRNIVYRVDSVEPVGSRLNSENEEIEEISSLPYDE